MAPANVGFRRVGRVGFSFGSDRNLVYATGGYAWTLRDGVVEETGLGAGVLDDPITGIIWLARRMGQYGQRIEPGQIILSGSFIRALECPPGSHIDADFGPFGRLTCSFA